MHQRHPEPRRWITSVHLGPPWSALVRLGPPWSALVRLPAETPNKIMRYETTLERQLYRAMNQLERLQRTRRGEPGPSPVLMGVRHAARAVGGRGIIGDEGPGSDPGLELEKSARAHLDTATIMEA